MRVKFTDRTLRKSYLEVLGIISTLVTIISFFVSIQDCSNRLKLAIFVTFVISLIVIFFVMWWKANLKKKVKLKINNTNVEIKVGDILQFDEEKEISVITVNEYFDMIADDHLVLKKSIHGQFIEKMEREGKISQLIDCIKQDESKSKGLYIINKNRNMGNKVKHPIGSMVKFDSYILTAFAKDDENELAYLYGEDYMAFLMQFWENLPGYDTRKTINLPLMGAGVMNLKNGTPNKHALLELILLSLNLSGYKNKDSTEKINIIIHERDAAEIDFYHLQHNSSFK